MADYFFDTSAFVKYFAIEQGSDIVINLIDKPINNTWITELTLTEFYCALYRKFRNNELSEQNLETAISAFENQTKKLQVLDIDAFTFEESRHCVKEYGKAFGLRTLDALQIAAFKIIAEKNWTFVAADALVCKLIRAIGFDVINPVIDMG
jgi:predicted nucleic acid-binding protein